VTETRAKLLPFPPPARREGLTLAAPLGTVGTVDRARVVAAYRVGAVSAAVAELLEQRLAAAEEAWPGVVVAPEVFAAYVGRRVPGDASESAALAALHVEDLYLACACAHEQPAALRAFDRCHLDRVDGFVRRLDASPAFLDEVRQVLRHRLLIAEPPRPARIEDYSGRGALASWVGVAAQRVAVTLLRAAGPDGGGGEDALAAQISQDPDPELEYVRTRYRSDFGDALRHALAALPDEERTLLRLYYVDGLSLEKLALLKQVSFSTMSRRLQRTREAISEVMHRALEQRLRLTQAEVSSLARLVRTGLEDGLFRMLHDRSLG
jgi:RNA polymerase sigma-70 factor (ECF subfamily)